MRLIFAGTPEFAAVTLRRLLRCNHEVVLVLTQPDAPSGRGLKKGMSPVKEVALGHGIALQQPPSLKDPQLADQLAQFCAEAVVVAAYGLILPKSLLSLPRFGCLNVHASLLPRWRGAAPIQRAIMAGDRETGVCIMRMEEGLDTGPVYLCQRTPIGRRDTAGTLHDRLAELGADAMCKVLQALSTTGAPPMPQAAEGITYATKILRADTRIDWNRPAAEIERQLRALDPVPGAYTDFQGLALKIWSATVQPGIGVQPPGTIMEVSARGIDVQCADAILRVLELQRPGGRRMPAEEFLRGFKLPVGARVGA